MQYKIKKFLFSLIYFISVLNFFIISFLGIISKWYFERFNVSLEGLLFTLKSPKTGSNTDVIISAAKWCSPRIFLCWFILLIIILFGKYLKKRHVSNNYLYPIYKIGIIIGSLFIFFIFIYGLNVKLGIYGYLNRKKETSTLYEEYYVHPDSVLIEGGEGTNNLIYIYMESIESDNTYIKESNEVVSLTPNLDNLAMENIIFSNNDELGGFYSPSGTDWTMGGLMASSSGIPFKFPVDGNDMANRKSFAPKLITLGDILKDNGYTNMFMCGSDSEYGGRSVYYYSHGYEKIFDFFDAYPGGWDEYNIGWWGIEDEKLFDYAKEELLKLSGTGDKFSFSLITVDTHFGDGVTDGYICRLCDDEYNDRYANVIACQDKQVYEFIEWIKEQDFFDNTTIVITGDHPFMGTHVTSYEEQPMVYNCIINSKIETANTKNREFTTFDLFPTTLAAMGFNIEGNKLGLGVNLFSEQETLAEQMGIYVLNSELQKYSQYYVDEFQ